MENCVFCKIASGEIPSEKIFESDNFIVVKDINPKVEGHSLIVSRKHYDNFMEMPQELYGEILMVAKSAVKKLGIMDFNLVVNNGRNAGQIIPHFHLHILPRRVGDKFGVGV